MVSMVIVVQSIMAINYFVVETLDLSDPILLLLLAKCCLDNHVYENYSETITISLVASLYNECTGVQNSHRYMHAYSMAHSVYYGACSI